MQTKNLQTIVFTDSSQNNGVVRDEATTMKNQGICSSIRNERQGLGLKGLSQIIAVWIHRLWYNSGKLDAGVEGLFFKKRVQRDDDRIWMTTDLKWNGIVDEVLRERAENVFILVVAYFKKTAAELKKGGRISRAAQRSDSIPLSMILF